MSMNLVAQKPGRGSGSSRRDQKTPVNVVTAATSHPNIPTASSHGVDPADITMMPKKTTANAA